MSIDQHEDSFPVHEVPQFEDNHKTGEGTCECKPFVYEQHKGSQIIGYVVRHNSWDALPVDEEALEKAQGLG